MKFKVKKQNKKMNKKNNNIVLFFTIFFLSLLFLVFFSKGIFSINEFHCCIDPNDAFFCTAVFEDQKPNTTCTLWNTSKNFSQGCFNLNGYEGALECNPPYAEFGYCCNSGSTSLMNKSNCDTTIYDFVTYNGQEYEVACNVNNEECDKNVVDFKVESVKGEKKVLLTWNLCDDGTITLERSDKNNPLLENSFLKSYIDDSIEWNNNYEYVLKVDYPGTSYDKTVRVNFESGDEICEGKYDNDPFCYSDTMIIDGLEKSNFGGYCDDNNKFHLDKECTSGYCKIIVNEDNVKEVVCALSDSCEEKNEKFYTGELDKEYCETIQEGDRKGEAAYCFYDNKSYSVQGYCYSCMNVNCFSYKSEDSCNSDPCGVGSCVWKPIIGEVNGGVCVSVIENNCEILDDVEKNSGVSSISYSQILQPLFSDGSYSYSELFSNNNYVCTNTDVECYSLNSCLDYNTKEECNDNSCLDVNCGWTGNSCVRLNENNEIVCEDNDEECEKDWFSPISELEYNADNNLFEIVSLKDKTNRFDYYKNVNLNEVSFYACIVLKDKNECNNKEDFVKIDTTTFSIGNVISEEDFKSILGKDSVIVYYSKDKYDNYEDFKTLNFKALYYDTVENDIVLLSPKTLGVKKDEPFNIIIKPNFASSKCEYAILKDNLDERNVEYNNVMDKTVTGQFYVLNQKVDSDVYLYFSCVNDVEETLYYKKFFLKVFDSNKIVDFDVYAVPNVLFSQNVEGNYETNITVISDQDVFCKYSLEEKEDENYNFDDMNFFYGTNENFDYKDFFKQKNYTLIIPNSFSDKEFNVTVKCINKIYDESEIKKVEVKITNDPEFDDWVKILSPDKKYYNNNSVLFNVSVFVRNAFCSVKIDNVNENQFELENDGIYFYKTVDLSQGEHEILFRCGYNYIDNGEEKTHLDYKNIFIVVDSNPPNVSFSIIGDAYDSGRPIVYSKVLKVDSNITDLESGVLSAVYSIYSEDKNELLNKGVFEDTIELPDLENNKVYTLVVSAVDYAGNIGKNEESFKTDFSIYCSNNVFDIDYETDVDCGFSCPSCGVGKSCNSDSDCNEGLLCDEVYNKCYANTCYDNIKNGDETGVDCGGSCVECKKDLVLIYPKFGISSKEEFNVLINSSKKMVCNYKFDDESYKVLDNTAKFEHYIYNVKIKNNEKKRLYLNCTDGNDFYSETFVLKVDVKKPSIVSYEVNPKVNNVMTNKNGILSFWSELNVLTDKNTVCKFNIDSSGSYDTFNGIFDRGDENNSKDYILNHNVWIPLNLSEHNVYVVCKALNSLNSDVYVRKIDNNPYSNVSFIILNPLFGKVYSSDVLAVIDSTVNSNYCKYTIDGFEEKILDKNSVDNNIFSSEFKVISSGSHVFTAVCNYNKYDVKGNVIGDYNVSLKRSFFSDLDKPVINSFVIEDPYSSDDKVLSDNSLKLYLDYVESNVYSFIFTVYVNENEILQKTFFGEHNTFYINNLNLSNDDKVKVKVKIVDSVGNFEEKESNYLNVNLKEHDKNLLGEKCNFDYECKEGVCSNNICISESEICSNDFFDSYYETTVDKGGLCALKYNKRSSVGEDCISSLDCEKGSVCSNNICTLDIVSMCNNNVKDVYESDVDCGDLCEFYLDKSCSLKQKCNSNADCNTNKCDNGVCVENNVKIIPEYCFEDVFNNSFVKDNKTFFCGDECEFKCPLNVGCRNNFDCEIGLSCVNNTCIKEEVKKETCEPTDFIQNCGGTCDEKCPLGSVCESDSDCKSEYKCEYNPDKEERVCVKATVEKIEGLCLSNNDCSEGEVCDLETNTCVEKKSNFWMYFLIFILLLIFSGSMFMLYLYYYKPEEFEKIKNKFESVINKNKIVGKDTVKNDSKTNVESLSLKQKSKDSKDFNKNISSIKRGEPLKSSFGINNVKNKPIVEKEKQERIKELIRKKRLEEKRKEREEFLKKLEESKLDKNKKE